jgi:hypothetical protein
MSDKVNTLVLGVGGNVSQGILKTLAIGTVPCRVVRRRPHSGCSSSTALLFPLAQRILCLCRGCSMSAGRSILTQSCGAWVRSSKFSPGMRNGSARKPPRSLIVSAPDKLAIANDKLRTREWLRDHGLRYSLFAATEDREDIERLVQAVLFPLIAKPRGQKSSEGFVVIRDRDDLDRYGRQPAYVIEPYLGSPDQEYAAATFSDTRGAVRLHDASPGAHRRHHSSC